MRKLNKKYYLKNKRESGRQAIWDHNLKQFISYIYYVHEYYRTYAPMGYTFSLDHLFILELFPCCSLTSQPTVSGSQIEIKRNVLP